MNHKKEFTSEVVLLLLVIISSFMLGFTTSQLFGMCI